MSEPEKLDLRSMDIAKEQKEKLSQFFPEIFTEDKIDFEKLKLTLGESIEVGKERYGMNWPGKSDCFKIIQNPSIGTLKPYPEESVNFDKTENLFIEGDNLEVLKLLQKSYYGKVKMIYIDPPYNTGNDFIYPDDYTENLTTYLQYTGQVDAGGKKFSTNADTEGRFHTKWINMMYPRLFLAKNLLRDDGVIFISIDDNETHNLRKICDEIFGEENLLITFYAQVRYAEKTLAEKNDYQKIIEQVLVYQKSSFKPKKETERYGVEKFCWKIVEKNPGQKIQLGGRDAEIFKPEDYEIIQSESNIDGLKETWATGSVLKANASGKFFGDYIAPRKNTDGLGCLYKINGIGEDGLGYRYFTGPKKETATKGKFYSGVPLVRRKELEEEGESLKEKPIVNFGNFADSFGNCRHEGSVDFRSGKKPVAFLKALISMVSTEEYEDTLMLDFFAGSASFAHAVMDANKEDDGNRRFILVQLPELLDQNISSQKDGYEFCLSISKPPNVAEVGKERIRRVIKNIAKEKSETLFKDKQLDLGFKAFKLDKSNFKIWDVEKVSGDKQALEKQLELHIDHIDPKAKQEDLLYEILLKAGFELTTKIEKIELAGKTVYSIEDGAMLVCLEKELTKEVIKAMAEKQPSRVICLDQGFVNNDQLKTNAVQIMKTKGVDDFRTV
jgi:adenine-specific DNA-methyltransferase